MNITAHDYVHHQNKKLKRLITNKYKSSTIPENHSSSSNEQTLNTTSNNSIDDVPSLVNQSSKDVNLNEAINNKGTF